MPVIKHQPLQKRRIVIVPEVAAVRHRIAMWATAGFLVAGFWALFAFTSGEQPLRNVWTFVGLTCPVAIGGMHYPISLFDSLVANAATYGAVGLVVETIRKQLRHSH